jgi:hypothetical protein
MKELFHLINQIHDTELRDKIRKVIYNNFQNLTCECYVDKYELDMLQNNNHEEKYYKHTMISQLAAELIEQIEMPKPLRHHAEPIYKYQISFWANIPKKEKK